MSREDRRDYVRAVMEAADIGLRFRVDSENEYVYITARAVGLSWEWVIDQGAPGVERLALEYGWKQQ